MFKRLSQSRDFLAPKDFSFPLTGVCVHDFLLLRDHVAHDVCHLVNVAKVIATQGSELDNVVVVGNDSSSSIKSRRVSVIVKVTKNSVNLSIAHDTLEMAFSCLFYHLPDTNIFGIFL